MFDKQYFVKTCQYVFECNKANGWHDNERTIYDFFALFHSEPSEATEAVRHGNPPDNHLKQYPGVVAEFIDTGVRIFDFLGSRDLHKHPDFVESVSVQYDWQIELATDSETEMICELHSALSYAYRYYESCDHWQAYLTLVNVVMMCFKFVEMLGYDPKQVLTDKVEYNRNRPDHKRENRALENGKKL